jgi:2-polyprenyl-6-methoxyphenol hydroxylase-like FAD-dependent oxidoreductase
VVGGGTTGNSLTILLRRAGIDVDLVEIDPGWNVLGSGITL